MAKTKTKRNVPTSNLHSRFKICREPVVGLGTGIQSSDADDSISLPQLCQSLVLFAIARDEHTIFVSWMSIGPLFLAKQCLWIDKFIFD